MIRFPINRHVTNRCNYRCVFCFARNISREEICNDLERSREIIKAVAEIGSKINFAGGEPLLCNTLGELLKLSKRYKLTTAIITNASLLTTSRGKEFLEQYSRYLDRLGVSIDASDSLLEQKLGRGFGRHVENAIEAIELARRYNPNIKIKINTVVTRLNLYDDMHSVIERIKPDRRKVFQMKIVPGNNDHAIDLTITEEEFREYIERHRDLSPIAETSEEMSLAYVMIHPDGSLVIDTAEGYKSLGYFPDAIKRHEVRNLLENIYKRIVRRGGIYNR